jgi:hypothetical protein
MLLLANALLILAGIYAFIRAEIKASSTFVILGRAAQSIGLALIIGGLLAYILPHYCLTAGIIHDPASVLHVWFASVGAAFAYIARVIFGEMRKPAMVKTMLQAPDHMPQQNPAAKDALLQTPRPRLEESEFSRFELICIFLNSGNAKARTWALQLNAALLKTAADAGQRRRVDSSFNWRTDPALAHLPAELPVGWQNDDQIQMTLRQSALLKRDRAFLLTCWPDMSAAISAAAKACAHQENQLHEQHTRWTSLSPAHLWTGVTQPPGTKRPAAIDTWAANETRLAELAKLAAVAPAGADIPDALKLLLCWPDRASTTFLLQACVTPSSQVYASQALAARMGAAYTNWWEWEAWLKRAASEASQSRAEAIRLIDEFGPELATIWLREQPGTPDPALDTALGVVVAERARQKTDPIQFVHRWRLVLTPAEIDRISSSPIPRQVHIPSEPVAIPPPLPERPRILPLSATPSASSATAEPAHASPFQQEVTPILPLPIEPVELQPLAPEPVPVQPLLPTPPSIAKRPTPMAPPPLPVTRQVEQPERPIVMPPLESRGTPGEDSSPSVWDEHIRPFLAANWYIIAGLLMVLGGASLLAYFTWDKSRLVQYLFLPVLLASFTGGMGQLGLRLIRKHENLRASGAFLLGGAVCLLPVNFMALSRAGEDPNVSGLVLFALGLYTALAGLGLWRWCGAVRPELRILLGLPLLAVNLLAVLGDMPGIREVAAGHHALLLPAALTAAVLLLLAVSNRFLRLVLTKELLERKIVPWFFGVTIAATTVQVAIWRHFQLHLVPRPQDYALAVILVGATLLRWERRAGQLRDTVASHGGESFLGYAALLLGILMAAGNEWLRIVALLLTGVIWLVQAPRRPGVVHYWIGCTLCLFGGAAVGLLDSFPKTGELNLLPELGLALALLAGAVRALAARRGEIRLRDVAREIQPPILLISSMVAVLSQDHLHSAPWQTGLVLVAVALFFAVRATWETRHDWLNIAAAAAGLALPYLGGADMLRYRFEENTLGLGFGLLATAWLTAAYFLRRDLWRRSGPVVATGYGVAGILGLCLRLVLANRPEIAAAELAGGILLASVLGVAAWQLRSPGRGLLAAGLLAVILPLFRAPADIMPAWLHVGTGLTSAAAALGLMLGCFRLRRLAAAGSKVPPANVETSAQKAAFIFLLPLLAAVSWLIGKALVLQLVQVHHDQVPFVSSMLLASATLYAAAIYFRHHPAGRALFHASWPLLGAGVAMACDGAGCRGAQMFEFSLLWTGLALTALLAAEWAAARRHEWAATFLVRPRLQLLAYGSALVAVPTVLAAQIPFFAHRDQMGWLALFLAAQLIWHGLRTSQRRFGAVLFVLVFSRLCDWLGLPASFGDLPGFLLAVFMVDLVLELFEKPRAFVKPLRAPFIAGATLLSTALAVAAVLSIQPTGGGALDFVQPRMDLGVILVALLLAARAQVCAGFALPVAALGYLLCLLPCGPHELFRPWRLAEFALLLGLLPFLGRALLARWPLLLRGPSPQLPGSAAAPQAPWLAVPGLALAAGAAAVQIAISSIGRADDARWVQVFAPFAAVFAFSLAGLYWRKGALWAVALCLLPVANLFALSVLWGHDLLKAHLMPVHIGGIAAILTVAEFAAARWLVLRSKLQPASRLEAAQWLHYGCTALAGLTLVLLGLNYLANPDLAQIPDVRFALSGSLALGAGTYFRFAARRPENLRTQDGVWLESLWHVALGLAIWCAALLIPALRTPHAAIYALALPAVALWAAAEWFLTVKTKTEENVLTGTRFRANAAAFSVLILALYIFRLPFQMLLFPTARLELDVYHTGAAAMILMGILLIRVRGLGGAPWSALVGGLALMTGFYFGVTWLPGLSPFDFPMAGAWTAVGAAHLLILVSSQRSPLRSLIQYIGGISEEEWHAHRRQWGIYLTAAAHVAVVAGLIQAYGSHSLETTPLLLALASVLIYQAVLGIPWADAYWVLAGFEILLALHLDFLLPAGAPGLIPARDVVWFLLAPWLAAVAGWRRLEPRIECRHLWTAAIGLAVLCAGHLYYHGPATGSGVLIAALMLLAALLTPAPAADPGAQTGAALMFVGPIWLAYFGTRWLTGDGVDAFRPLFAGSAALLGSGMLVRLAGRARVGTDTAGSGVLGNQPRPAVRLADEVLALCRRSGETIARGLMIAAFASLTLLTFLHPSAAHGSLGTMLALAFVWGMSCVAWFREGRFRDGVLPYALSLLSAAGAWIILRRLLFQYFTFWTVEYDTWLSLGASIAFSAALRLIKHEQPGLGRTMTGAVWLLPVLQCVWLFYHRLGPDLTLLVIGVQSMLFAWQGGGKRDSPYNAVSMLGFVGFACLLFWAKLDLRCVQAYTIPVGLGVLGLVWLFGQHMQPPVRNAVRLTTVLIMLGSCGYYALLDSSYSFGFHLTMLLLCLAMMALGPLLRVQLYLYLGFAGFAADLATLVVQQFRTLDRSIQMMGVGALLLLLGIVVVGGAIYYKTHHEALRARFAAVRARLGGWE